MLCKNFVYSSIREQPNFYHRTETIDLDELSEINLTNNELETIENDTFAGLSRAADILLEGNKLLQETINQFRRKHG